MAAMNSLSFGVVAIIAVLYAVVLPMAHATRLAPAPAPAPALTSDGTAIDQGIAYGLMLLALVLTYLIH
ncbi:arabinogalactan protein 41 [Pyrus x bretschneideri]|uniref:arabinogalactan protein 41 n=1 Tax=Pyrus x bretschneideri TaxID=225117 RepID=UPI0005108EC5|nr:arabinogalactan protein 41 [Pyrus x bretschneideri]